MTSQLVNVILNANNIYDNANSGEYNFVRFQGEKCILVQILIWWNASIMLVEEFIFGDVSYGSHFLWVFCSPSTVI